MLPALAKDGDIDAARREVEFYRAPQGSIDPTSYRARPLNGIACDRARSIPCVSV